MKCVKSAITVRTYLSPKKEKAFDTLHVLNKKKNGFFIRSYSLIAQY